MNEEEDIRGGATDEQINQAYKEAKIKLTYYFLPQSRYSPKLVVNFFCQLYLGDEKVF